MNIKALMRKMTLEEKAAQLYPLEPDWSGKFDWNKAKKRMAKGIGQVAIALRWAPPREAANRGNEIQAFLANRTRLGIPAIIHDECLHGLMANGCTVFPQAIGMAGSWEPDLMHRVATAIGRETRARGITQALSPTINIARDPRCGRTDETYGEDVCLASRIAVAFVKGLQAQGVITTPKHFATNFVGDGGRDSHTTHCSERILREIYFPVFEACFREAGALSVMAAYNSIDGVPCSCNRWLLTNVLRKEWGFKGFVVSDYGSVNGIYFAHKVAASKAEAARLALEAGLDVELPDDNCFKYLVRLVRDGKLPVSTLNQSVERVLSAKAWLRLDERRYVSPEECVRISGCQEHRMLALEAARRTFALLKNGGSPPWPSSGRRVARGVLPLGDWARKIAVIGPNAAEARTGSYSGFGVKLVSPLEGIKAKAGRRREVYFAEGCKLKGDLRKGFSEAIRAARKADVAVLCVGNAAGWDNSFTEGEGADRCELRLPGVQEDLISEVCKVNKNTAVVLINGSAVAMEAWADKVGAILECWYPGEEGGTAIAEALFGEINPGGKLPLTFPRRTGQLPLYYNYKPSGRAYDYTDLRGTQEMFPFGHGLSYTKFDYKNLKIRKEKSGVKVAVDVQNSGRRSGDEVVQIYVRDEYSKMSRPLKELKGFRRIPLEPGEKKTVEFVLGEKDFSYLDNRMKPVLEPGAFELMVGSSSGDIRLKGKVDMH